MALKLVFKKPSDLSPDKPSNSPPGKSSAPLANKPSNPPATPKYPLTEARLALVGMPLQAGYTVAEAVQFFQVRSKRTIHNWINSGKLASHDLPGNRRFTPQDFEEFLVNSKRPKREKK